MKSDMNRMILRTTTRAILDVVKDDIDQTGSILKKLHFDTQFTYMITLLTRFKILNMLQKIFKLLNNDNYTDVLTKLPLLHKRITLNNYQFTKLDSNKQVINSQYLRDSVLIIYKYIHCLKKLKY